jgi:hypothetical protein
MGQSFEKDRSSVIIVAKTQLNKPVSRGKGIDKNYRPVLNGKSTNASTEASAQSTITTANPETDVSKSAKTFVEKNTHERIIKMQEKVKQSWRGIDSLHTGRPGTANIVN